MKISLVAFLLLAGTSALRAESVELSGLASLFGEKMALLILYPGAHTTPVSFTLSEGQSQYGIKLIQVDTTSHQVEIEKDGEKKFISLCGLPVLNGIVNAPGGESGGVVPVDPKALAAFLNSNEEVARIKAGNPAVNFTGVGAKIGVDPVSDKNAGSGTSAGTGSSSSSASSTTTADHSKEVWYQESLTIEQSRIETAEDVLAGKATPWPRTPLTPANTPAGLIGKETYFPNHIPGYTVRGYVESLAAK